MTVVNLLERSFVPSLAIKTYQKKKKKEPASKSCCINKYCINDTEK